MTTRVSFFKGGIKLGAKPALPRQAVPRGMTFGEWCATKGWGAYTTEIERNLILHALSITGRPGPATEVGCEGGRWSRLLADAGWQMTCTDTDEQVLRMCQSRIPEV